MSRSIRISEKHGVNPTIPTCFYCGEDKNEVALLGKLPGDKEAPMRMWINWDYEPCDECKKKMEQGITFIEVDNKPIICENQISFVENAYPTGRWSVVKEEAVKRVLKGTDILELVLKTRKSLVDRETMKIFIGE